MIYLSLSTVISFQSPSGYTPLYILSNKRKSKDCFLSFSQYFESSKIKRNFLTICSKLKFNESLDGSDINVGIIRTRWNNHHVSNLLLGARNALKDCNVQDSRITEVSVPGSFEIPYATRLLALSNIVDSIICIGVLIKGETMHFEYISEAVSHGIMHVNLETKIPCIFGVLTCLTEDQVVYRSTGSTNHGYNWGKTCVELAKMKKEAFDESNVIRTTMNFRTDVSRSPQSDELDGSDLRKTINFCL